MSKWILLAVGVLVFGASECRAGWCLCELFGFRERPRTEFYEEEFHYGRRYYRTEPQYRILPYWHSSPRPHLVPQLGPSQHYNFGIENYYYER